VKYRCIDENRSDFAVGLMCRVLGVSRSGYYAWKARKPSQRRINDAVLFRSICEVYAGSKKRYGSPRIYRELKGLGVSCGRGRIARLMRKAHLRGTAQSAILVLPITSTAFNHCPRMPGKIRNGFVKRCY
jgi:putative transposase